MSKQKYVTDPGWNLDPSPVFQERSPWNAGHSQDSAHSQNSQNSVILCMYLGDILSFCIQIQTLNSVNLLMFQIQKWSIMRQLPQCLLFYSWLSSFIFPLSYFSAPKIVKLPPQSASLQNIPSHTQPYETQNPKRHTANKSQRVPSKMFLNYN